MGKVFSSLFGGGQKQKSSGAAQPAATKKLFNPEQIAKVTGDYTKKGEAKWNSILANMGAGGGTGGPDVSTAISGQAQALGSKLGELTDQSGYGSDGMAQIDQILKGLEPGIGAKYSVYG
jgi:hypothetical protein